MTNPWKPVRKQSLADAVFAQLRGRILRGELSPGETLPAERTLSEKLDVNRGAVREALKRLEQARLITIRHGGATKVLDFRETAGTNLLSALLVDEEGNLNVVVARSVIEMRSALAPSIARLCARRGQKVTAELDKILAVMKDSQDDLPTLQQASLDYWGALVQASENIAYQLAFNSLRESYAHFAHLLTGALAAEFEAFDDYQDLRQAIAEGDEDRASHIAANIIHIGEAAISSVLDALHTLTRSS